MNSTIPTNFHYQTSKKKKMCRWITFYSVQVIQVVCVLSFEQQLSTFIHSLRYSIYHGTQHTHTQNVLQKKNWNWIKSKWKIYGNNVQRINVMLKLLPSLTMNTLFSIFPSAFFFFYLTCLKTFFQQQHTKVSNNKWIQNWQHK